MSEASAGPKIIKRYSNRKLYDTADSRYVTLDEIAEMVKQGADVKIVDNQTKEDLTSVTLAQIVFEEEKKQNQMPLAVLREIIRRPGESLSHFFKSEVTPRVASIRDEANARLDKMLGREDADAAGGEWWRHPQKAIEELQKKLDDTLRLRLEAVLANLPALGRDVGALMSRIDELEQRLAALESRKGR